MKLKVGRWLLVVFILGMLQACNTPRKYVVVEKSDRKMYVKKGDKVLHAFNVSLGKVPVGKKTRRGDKKTPEGVYHLGYKNTRSSFYKSIHVSYPNVQDIKRARSLKVNPGNAIVIHGLPNRSSLAQGVRLSNKDWTDGCIALTNQDMDKFWSLINKKGTVIQIKP